MLRPLLLGLRAIGANVDEIASRAGLSLEMLEDPDARFPFEAGVELALQARAVSKDDAFSVHLAEMYRPGVFGVLDYLAHSSRTLGEAIGHLCRYNRLLQDAVETVLEVRAGRALLSQRALGDTELPGFVNENCFANLIVIGRALTGVSLVPLEVEFSHRAPSHAGEVERVFGTEVHFGRERDVLVLSADLLALPLPNANPELCAILDRHAQILLSELPRVPRMSQRVREFVAAELKSGAPTADSIARRLEMSERTLRRRLQEEETTFEDVLDGLRRRLAERYLGGSSLSVEEIALMLGYSESSAFRRAFRRWHKESPAAFRRALDASGN